MTISDSAVIHESAVISAGAVVGDGVFIGPYCVIGPNVVLGKASHLEAHVVITGNTTLGEGNKVFPFASIGCEPQDLKFSGEDSKLLIGNRNIIREYVTLQPGTSGGGLITSIGDQNLFMASTHVGHDCIVGNGNILANSAALSGHVTVGDFVTIGGLCGIHQFTRLGNHSFMGGGSMVVKDVPPFCLAQGDRAELFGLNTVGLRRHNFSPDDIRALKRAYKTLFLGSGKMKDRLSQLEKEGVENSHVSQLMSFVGSSDRGVTAASQDGAVSREGAASNDGD